MTVHVAYDERLLDWHLGVDHPTDPIRAKNALDVLWRREVPLDVQPITRRVADDELERVHSARHVAAVTAGLSSEWEGVRPDLGEVARHMFAGTAQLVDQLLADKSPFVGFSPQGAKHHAHWDHASGFCVYNDFAAAAWRLEEAGERVLYVDLDAHHGDGVEALTYANSRIMTASVHDRTIFPGTGDHSEPRRRVYNFPLERGSGDTTMLAAVDSILDIASSFNPTVVLVAIGGDGHADDPLSTLRYTYRGYAEAGKRIGEFACEGGGRVLLGGAGGYLPHRQTPMSWATFVQAIESASQE